MALETLNDEKIRELITCAKRVTNPSARAKSIDKDLRKDYRVSSSDNKHEFILFTRQSLLIPESFTAGLRWKSKTGEEIILLRCNGSDHIHGNKIEKTTFGPVCHIHYATERYIIAGKKVESFAEVTTQYETLAGALNQLVKIANITGIATEPDQPKLL